LRDGAAFKARFTSFLYTFRLPHNYWISRGVLFAFLYFAQHAVIQVSHSGACTLQSIAEWRGR